MLYLTCSCGFIKQKITRGKIYLSSDICTPEVSRKARGRFHLFMSIGAFLLGLGQDKVCAGEGVEQ